MHNNYLAASRIERPDELEYLILHKNLILLQCCRGHPAIPGSPDAFMFLEVLDADERRIVVLEREAEPI